ncbi:hypothetical protein Gpo141_00000567 [Globisporangium polare]
MMQDTEIHPIDMPHDEQAAPVDTSAPADDTSVGAVIAQTSVRSKAALRTSKRLKLFGIIFALVGCVAVGIGVIYQLKQTDGDATTSSKKKSSSVDEQVSADRAGSGKSIPVAIKTVNTDADGIIPSTFLSVSYSTDGLSPSQFVLSKKYWSKSFMVYPTIEKHSGPPKSGRERGSVMLDTSDYVFHFEKSMDGESLLFVPENHRTRLQSGNDDLKAMFDTSQWAGYYMKVDIETETDDAFIISADTFLSSGFFVSNALASDRYTIIPGGTKFYPRNSILRVEYEFKDGVAVVSYAIKLLPETVMSQRVADDRVGYFSTRYTLYGADYERNTSMMATRNVGARSGAAAAADAGDKDADDDGFHSIDPEVTVINRRRLELDSKTNKTKESIVYYIDPSVPARWRDAFVAGVEAWKPAFEGIGFKDAIKAVVPGDADWPLDYRVGDLRYNSISVMISDQTYAMGPSVIDPRSGEILHSDIIFEYGFFNEVMKDFDMQSPVDPPRVKPDKVHANVRIEPTRSSYGRLRQCGLGQHPHHQAERMLLSMAHGFESAYVPEEIIGHHFTDIVMHEVGHTLGLRHNFAGSSMISRKELNDGEFVETHGLSSSIMDYVPANIFSDLKPNKAATHKYYMTTIGAYDRTAIAYGYSIVDDEEPGTKSKTLTELARQAPFFLTDEDTDVTLSPYGQRFDLSNDPVDFANDRLDLAKLLRKSKVVAKIPDDASWTILWRREAALLRMINGTADIVSDFLGGANVSHAHRSKGEKKYAPPYVSKVVQQRALDVLTRIISGEPGLFPAPEDYSTYIQVRGFDGEDCNGPNLEYGCLARGLVDLDHVLFYIQKKAVERALFPAMQRIVAQDVNAPLEVTELLAALDSATCTSDGDDDGDTQVSRSKVVRAFLIDTLQRLTDDEATDVRISDAILATFPSITKSSSGDDSR